MQPINGISLERYADLGAAVADHMNDPQKVAEIVASEGVSPADWEAAKAGWTARMQDMSLMGRVAMAYMPLYQACVAKRKGGQATTSYEEFVAGSAAIKVYGYEVALRASSISSSDWTEVAAQWNQTMAREMMRFAGHPQALAQEEARLRAGGQPRAIQITRVAGQIPPTPAADANPYAAAMGAGGANIPANASPMQVAMANPAVQQQMQAQQAIARDPLGFGLGQAAAYMTGGIVAGTSVLVAWSDGNSYPGKVLQMAPGQMMVQFPNGSQQWVPEHAVRKA